MSPPPPQPDWADQLLDRSIIAGYSTIGFRLRSRRWPPGDPAAGAMRGRTALVTGAASGIGFAIAAQLTALGAGVILAVRNTDAGAGTRDRILADVPGADIAVRHCDLTDPATLAACARTAPEVVDVVVHNAGVLPDRRTETHTGHELTLATHVLGPLALTDLLLPALRRAPDPRVVFVASAGMYTQPLPWSDPEYRDGTYRGATAYARTKRIQVAFAPLAAEHWQIGVHAMHPGWVDTPGLRAALPAFRRVTAPILRDPGAGADTAVWLAATGMQLPNGQFWHDRRIRPQHRLPTTTYTGDQVGELWDYCRAAADIG
ncbi:SDR family NAD(P)-dependent oxidoreductase [Nocardia sp. SYP-A9097]|uniref:SDR family NAD(P)-dependent oxidoreductase n=1 Tax=Nocardia sp. SYP-A9097 TaxID=2663237 RepID=UPI00129B9A59|nr:SDR family NAD(P)-dependent oxidoreductase [Nocardia sp. SYP-A9097]MRH87588.1 SDR family NAD(P)-dependent oxidoreductase [Nocardia sp. SYP-A9097]